MSALQIDFEDGFDGDTVIVRADGVELWRGEGVTTNLAISLAAVVHVELPDGALLEVSVPTRGLAEAVRVGTPFLEAELVGGRLQLRESPTLPLHA